MSEENILNDISALIAQFEEQKKIIYSHYIQAVAKVVAGRITAEKEIERIMDGLLDFGDDEKFLALYEPHFVRCGTYAVGGTKEL